MAKPKFIQVEREIVRAIKELGAPAVAVYLVLCDYCWGKFGDKWWSWPSVKTMMSETRFSRRTVFLALSVLENAKWIKRAGRHTSGVTKWILLRRSPEWRGVHNDTPPQKEGVHSNAPDRCTDMHDGVNGAAPESYSSQTEKQTSSTNTRSEGTETERGPRYQLSEGEAAEVAEAYGAYKRRHPDRTG